MKRTRILVATAILLMTDSALAESLEVYADTCAEQLGLDSIPGYGCASGTSVPSGAALNIPSNDNYLGRVATTNPNVEAVFLCRDFVAGTGPELNGYILQNTISGRTCFFDAKTSVSTWVMSPNSSNSSLHWREPQSMAGACQTCHAQDPFIVTPGLAVAFRDEGMRKAGRNLTGAYTIVNNSVSGSHFEGWDSDRNITSDTCMNGCHNNSSNGAFTSIRIGMGAFMDPNVSPVYAAVTETPSHIGTWSPGANAQFHLDADNSHSWNSSIDKSGDFGETGDRPVVLNAADCSAGSGGKATFGVMRPHVFPAPWLLTSNNHWWDSAGDSANTFEFLNSGTPLSWNGVAATFDTGVSGGLFFVDHNNDQSFGAGDVTYSFGLSTDTPLIGRWKAGIGHRIGTFRNVNGLGFFYLDMNGNNQWDSGDAAFQFGVGTAKPYVGDFNGDGVDEVGVYDDGKWYTDLNNSFSWNGVAGGDGDWTFGNPGDIPVVSPGKWNCAW